MTVAAGGTPRGRAGAGAGTGRLTAAEATRAATDPGGPAAAGDGRVPDFPGATTKNRAGLVYAEPATGLVGSG